MSGFIPREKEQKGKIKFFGRKDYINEFNHRKNKLDEERRNIYNIYGEGGIGKSSLLEEFEKECKVENIKVIILDLKNINTRGSFYEKLFEQVGKKSIPTAHFLLGYLTYLKKKNPYFNINADTNIFIEESGLLADIIDWSDLLVKGVDEAVPVVGSSIKLTVKFFKKIKDKIKLDSNITKYLESSVEVEDIENQLGRFLSYDLIDLFRKHKFPGVIFMFDTYEATNQDIKNEIKFLIKELDNAKSMFVIMGRNEFEDDEKWGEGYYSQKLNRLSDLEIENILKNNKIDDDNIVYAIRDSSKGNPLYLELMVQTYHKSDNPTVQYFKNITYDEIYERFMFYNKKDESIFELLCVARFINFYIYENLTNKGFREFRTFKNTTLFSVVNKKYFMHDILKEHIIKGLPKERILQLHQKMFNYYNRAINDTENLNISDEFYEEALFHLIEQEELNLLQSWLLKIAVILEKYQKHYLLFPLYEQIIASLPADDADRLFVSLIKKNALEDDNRRIKIGSGLFEKYYKYIAIEYNDEVNQLVMNWLNKFSASTLADYVMNGYLKSQFTNGRDITKHIRIWLENHIDKYIFTSRLLSNYLIKKDTKTSDIEDLVLDYLSIKKYSTNFTYIFAPYLNNGGDLKAIEQSVQYWINDNKEEKKYFSHIVEAYLNNGGDLKAIEQSVQYWINNNKEEKKYFSHIVEAYLNNGGALEPILDSVVKWLNENNNEEELFSYIVQSYFNKNGDIYLIFDSLIIWLTLYFKNSAFPYILNILGKEKNLNEENKNSFYLVFITWLIYAISESKITSVTIVEIMKQSFDDFDNIDSVSNDVFKILEEYILTYKIENKNDSLEKYFLVCSKYLKFTKYSNEIREKFINEIPLLENCIEVPYCNKFYRKVVDLKYGALGIVDKIKLYPSLRNLYFKEYFSLGYDFIEIKDIYIEYLKQFLETYPTKNFLIKYSYINQYLNGKYRETNIDKIIRDIIKKNLKSKNPTKHFIFSYVKSEKYFFEIKDLIYEFISNGGDENIVSLRNSIDYYLKTNKKEKYHQVFLDFLEENKENDSIN